MALEVEGQKSKTYFDKLVFFFVDGKEFIKIYDKRNGEKVQIYVLNKIERDVFLSCINVISFEELKTKCSYIPESDIKTVLESFKEYGIVFGEDNFYLSLPLSYRQIITQTKKKEEKPICIS